MGRCWPRNNHIILFAIDRAGAVVLPYGKQAAKGLFCVSSVGVVVLLCVLFFFHLCNMLLLRSWSVLSVLVRVLVFLGLSGA